MASNEIGHRRPIGPLAISLVLTTLVISALLFFSHCQTNSKDSEVYLNHHDSVDYVGIQTCAACHPDKFESFMHTGMGSSFGLANREKSSALFGPEHLVVDSLTGLSYYPYWKDDALWVKEFLLESGDTIHTLDVRLDYIIGSGQHTNSHLFERNGFVFQAPLTFYTQASYWELPPGFEGGNNSRFNRMIDLECMSCHNALPSMNNASDRQFESIPLGIDCERCHGPGALHVKWRQEGRAMTENGDPSIVNPARLSWERQIDVCQRCHLQGLNLLKEGKSFSDFRPGMKLSSVFDVYLPMYTGDDQLFDMANHADRFQRSACFIASNKSEAMDFTCISCHDPHKGISQTPKDFYRSVCMDCHNNDVCLGIPEAMHMDSADCISCHMPESESSDILHVRIHDHYIRKPIKKDQQDNMQKLIGLYAVNNPNPSKEEEIQAYLEYWEKFDKNPFYLSKAEQLLKGEALPHLKLKLAYLKEDYAMVVDLANEIKELGAWEAYMVGEAMLQTGEYRGAKVFLQMSYLDNPDLVEVGIRLLKTLNITNEHLQAERLGQELIHKHPLSSEVWTEYAISLIKQSKSADDAVRNALKYGPLDLNVWELQLNYAVISNKPEERVYWAKRILERYPEHQDAAVLKSYL